MYQDLLPHFSPLHQIHHQRQSIHTIPTTHKTLKHNQRAHYPVDNRPPWDQQALTAHHLNTHHHSQLYLHSNTPAHTQPKKTPQSSPTTQPKQQSPIGANTNPATQPSIPAAETHQPVSSSPPQHIPKSANGEEVKNSKQESGSSAPDGQLCFCCKQPGHLKKDFQSNCTAPGAAHKDTYLQGALLNSKATSQIRKDVNFKRTARAIKLTKKSGKSHRISHSSCTRTTNVYTVLVITNLVIPP